MESRRKNGCNTLYKEIKIFHSRDFFFLFFFLWAGGLRLNLLSSSPPTPLILYRKKD